MYVITGATGNTGNRVAHALLNAGKDVRVIGRSTDKMQEFVDKGADVFEGDVSNPNDMKHAFSGAKAAYLMIPPRLDSDNMRKYQNDVIDAYVAAIKDSDLSYAVTLSSVGADLNGGNGPVAGLYDMEQKLNAIDGLNVLHLRPAYFLENTLGQAGMVKQMGMMGSPIAADFSLPMIATSDIAAYATKRLLGLDFEGKSVQELQGQRELSYGELAGIYGKAIGKQDLKYVRVSDEQFVGAMTGMGVSNQVAESYVELSRGLESGQVAFRESRNMQNTTPTSPEEFSQVFAMVYKQA